MVAHELQLLYARSHDLTSARHRLWRILDRCARSDVPEEIGHEKARAFRIGYEHFAADREAWRQPPDS